MRELNIDEICVVIGAGVSTNEGAGAVLGYLSSEQPSNPFAAQTAARLKEYRSANPGSTSYADLFQL